MINFVKKNYFENQFEMFKGDVKNTRVTIKSILKNNKNNSKTQTKFLLNGNIIEGDLKIATEFNKFFTNIGPKLASRINPTNTEQTVDSFLNTNNQNVFNFIETNPYEVKRIIIHFPNKQSMDYNNLNLSFIKKNTTSH